MKEFTLSGKEYFDELPQPVLLVQDHRLRYFNRAAERAFWPVRLEEDGLLPPALALEADGAVTLGGQGWICQKRVLSEGALYVLHQALDGEEAYEVLLERLSGRNTGQLQQLSRILLQLENQLVETERLRSEPLLAQMRQLYAKMLRTDQNISCFCQLAPGQADENFPLQVLDMAGLCREAVRQCDCLLETVGITLDYSEEASSVLVRGNEKLILHLIYNLLSNSARSYHRRPGTITVRMELVGDNVMVVVDDGGVGISPAILRTVFDLEKDVSGLHPFGLGLPLGRKIANYHGGSLFLLAKQKGSRAVFSLPTVQSHFHRRQEFGRAERLFSLRVAQDSFHPAMVGLSDVVSPEAFSEQAVD